MTFITHILLLSYLEIGNNGLITMLFFSITVMVMLYFFSVIAKNLLFTLNLFVI